ncbi:MAG: hypothetical protein K0U47_12425 [Epsilonproteobacteria bacterium]|nr:hypothetical protein [Campylobacterota bacterium]
MTQEQHFAIVIRYFLLLTVLLLITGAWMFTLHTHWSVDGTTAYYTQKSFFGLLETVSPHLFGMSIIFFILTHFLL